MTPNRIWEGHSGGKDGGQSLGVLLQIRIDLRCVKIAMPDERLPAISISLDPTDDSSSCWVSHRLVVAPATDVFFRFLLPSVVP